MEHKYTLYYFNIKALAEPIRLLLSYGNIKFEDVRIPFEDWPKHKESMPMKAMPVLQIGDKKLIQSTAICRYLAKKVGLSSENELENLEIDIAVDTVHDLRSKAVVAHYEPDEKHKEEKYKTLTESFHFYLEKLNEKAASGHLALQKLTWADIIFAGLYDYLVLITRIDIGAKYLNLKKIVENVNEIPQIKKWNATAPSTPF